MLAFFQPICTLLLLLDPVDIDSNRAACIKHGVSPLARPHNTDGTVSTVRLNADEPALEVTASLD
jgi:hypothetical protein